jgi:hypothetical protein
VITVFHLTKEPADAKLDPHWNSLHNLVIFLTGVGVSCASPKLRSAAKSDRWRCIGFRRIFRVKLAPCSACCGSCLFWLLDPSVFAATCSSKISPSGNSSLR